MDLSTLDQLRLSLVRELASIHGNTVDCYSSRNGSEHCVTIIFNPSGETYTGFGDSNEDAEADAILKSIGYSQLFYTVPKNDVYFCEWPIITLQALTKLKRKDITFVEEGNRSNYYTISITVLGKRSTAKATNPYTAGMLAIMDIIRYYALTNTEKETTSPQLAINEKEPACNNVYDPDQRELCMFLEMVGYPSNKSANYIAECMVENLRYTAEACNPQLAKVEACKRMLAQFEGIPYSLGKIRSLKSILRLLTDTDQIIWSGAESAICDAIPQFKIVNRRGSKLLPIFTSRCEVSQLSVLAEGNGNMESHYYSAILMLSLLTELGIPYDAKVMQKLNVSQTPLERFPRIVKPKRSFNGIREKIWRPVKISCIFDKGSYISLSENGFICGKGQAKTKTAAIIAACRSLVNQLILDEDKGKDSKNSNAIRYSAEDFALKCFNPLPHQTKLDIPHMLHSPRLLKRYLTLYPNITTLNLHIQHERLLRHIWSTWPQLEELTVTLNPVLSKNKTNLNSIFSGYDDRACSIFEHNAAYIPETFLDHGYLMDMEISRSLPSICNLKCLKHLNVKIDTDDVPFNKPLTDLFLCHRYEK